jgi:hypothetical protein
MKTYTIAPVPPVSAKALTSAYVGAFAILWMFVEPLSALGLIPQFTKSSGALVYALLLLASSVVVVGFLRAYRWSKTHNLPSITLTIKSAADGATYHLRINENMQIGDALTQYVAILLKGPARDQVKATASRYYPIFQVRRDGEYIDLNSNLTVREAGLANGDECQVRAQIYEHFNQVMYSRAEQESPASDDQPIVPEDVTR